MKKLLMFINGLLAYTVKQFIDGRCRVYEITGHRDILPQDVLCLFLCRQADSCNTYEQLSFVERLGREWLTDIEYTDRLMSHCQNTRVKLVLCGSSDFPCIYS